jgi:4'-phosphopantetheinyl transferase
MHSLARGDLEIWGVSISDDGPEAESWRALEQSERVRASRFRTSCGRQDFVRGRAAMRTILAGYLALAPDALRFSRGQYGKPFLRNAPGLHFNWSHAGPRWLLAVSSTGFLGIDIERVRHDFDWRGPAGIALHACEMRYVERGAAAAAHRFFEIWTRKEAAFKGIGTGLHDDMATISLVDDAGLFANPAEMLDGTQWEIHEIPAADGYVAAVATQFRASRIHLRSYGPSSHVGVDWADGRRIVPDLRLSEAEIIA